MKLALLFLLLQQDPATLFKSATTDMDAGKWADAAPKFEQILKDDPSHIPSEFSLAVCYSKLGKPELSMALYRKIREQDPNIYEVQFNLAVLLHESGKAAEADQEFLKAAAMRPQDTRPLLYHAEFLEKKGDIAGALETYALAFNQNQSDVTAQQALELFRRRQAAIYRAAGEYDKAIEMLAPLRSGTNEELALLYLDKKDYGKAGALFDLLLKGAPTNARYLLLLGRCQMELKQYPRVVQTMRAVLLQEPENVEAVRNLASAYQSLQDWPHAAETTERFIQLRPQDPLGYFVLATYYERLEKLKQALVNYNKFLELDDHSNDARSFQARERAKTLGRRLNP
jgi:tetratricopeptide (TPR) repeat protein